jgi:hypothetical protein
MRERGVLRPVRSRVVQGQHQGQLAAKAETCCPGNSRFPAPPLRARGSFPLYTGMTKRAAFGSRPKTKVATPYERVAKKKSLEFIARAAANSRSSSCFEVASTDFSYQPASTCRVARVCLQASRSSPQTHLRHRKIVSRTRRVRIDSGDMGTSLAVC